MKKIKPETKKKKNNYFKNYVESPLRDDNTLWKATKNFKQPQTPIHLLRTKNSG